MNDVVYFGEQKDILRLLKEFLPIGDIWFVEKRSGFPASTDDL